MKGRIIAVLLVLVLGLCGCGNGSAGEIVTTAAATTAATFEMSTPAETTAEATTVTTKAITTTTAHTTTSLPEPIPDTPFKDIEFTADYRSANNESLKHSALYYETDFSYTADGVTVYTEGVDRSLYVKIADSDDEPIFIEKYVDNIIFTNGEITYTNYHDVKIYDLKTGEITLDFYDWGYHLSGIARNGDKIAYSVIAILADHVTFTDLSVLDLNTMKIERIYTGYFHNFIEDDVKYDFDDNDQTILHDSYNFDNDGDLYYAVLADRREEGFHKFIIYKHNFENKKTEKILTETTVKPIIAGYYNSVFISESDGMYYTNQKGELIKL
ncbi:MAG: hypothetical protein LBM87_02415 [Ruminococcus sp.]|jgi:hypothetical protein|nr:hypothetical protein [Ruminococcus sp.]